MALVHNPDTPFIFFVIFGKLFKFFVSQFPLWKCLHIVPARKENKN